MKLYVDDDLVAALLQRLLAKANHDIALPAQYGLGGADDSVHLLKALVEQRVLISGNHDDYLHLHNLVVQSGGHHAGILMSAGTTIHAAICPRGRLCVPLRMLPRQVSIHVICWSFSTTGDEIWNRSG